MPLKIRCSCGAVLLAPEERIGQIGKCPSCNRSISVDLSMSKTQEIMQKLELEKTQRTEQEKFNNAPANEKKVKKSFINKILSLFIYSIFFILVTGLFFIHYTKDLSDIKVSNSWLQSIWEEQKESLIGIKYSHRYWFQKIVGKKRKPKNTEK